MNKKQIIEQIVKDLPTRDMRGEMTNEEWYGWFEECWDKAITYEPLLVSRYFAVAYSGRHEDGIYTGLIDIHTNSGYLNSAGTIESIRKAVGITNVVITNIIEMTKEDFDSWTNDC